MSTSSSTGTTSHRFQEEFAAVDLLLNSGLETRGVDAFALALIKHERQLRRLVTFTVYQFPCFKGNADQLRNVLAASRDVYDDGFIKGLDALWPRTLADVVGPRHDPLRQVLAEARKLRGKVFHGQITDKRFGRAALLEMVDRIKEWCDLVANGAEGLVGYDGFGRNSYRDGPDPTLHQRLKRQLHSLTDFEAFVADTLER